VTGPRRIGRVSTVRSRTTPGVRVGKPHSADQRFECDLSNLATDFESHHESGFCPQTSSAINATYTKHRQKEAAPHHGKGGFTASTEY